MNRLNNNYSLTLTRKSEFIISYKKIGRKYDKRGHPKYIERRAKLF